MITAEVEKNHGKILSFAVIFLISIA